MQAMNVLCQGPLSGPTYLDFECSLKSAGKKPSEGTDQGRKSGKGNAVDLEGIHPDGFLEKGKRRKFSNMPCPFAHCLVNIR